MKGIQDVRTKKGLVLDNNSQLTQEMSFMFQSSFVTSSACAFNPFLFPSFQGYTGCQCRLYLDTLFSGRNTHSGTVVEIS